MKVKKEISLFIAIFTVSIKKFSEQPETESNTSNSNKVCENNHIKKIFPYSTDVTT